MKKTGYLFFLLLPAFGLLVACGARDAADLSGWPNEKYPHELTGYVIKIADGDTFTMLIEPGHRKERIRLVEIDSPERHQAYSNAAKQHLAAMVYRRTVKVYYRKRDRYRRILGRVFVDTLDVNRRMVCDGYAWHFKRYSRSRDLARCEEQARKKRLGLWQDARPVPPWEWRKNHRRHVTAF